MSKWGQLKSTSLVQWDQYCHQISSLVTCAVTNLRIVMPGACKGIKLDLDSRSWKGNFLKERPLELAHKFNDSGAALSAEQLCEQLTLRVIPWTYGFAVPHWLSNFPIHCLFYSQSEVSYKNTAPIFHPTSQKKCWRDFGKFH